MKKVNKDGYMAYDVGGHPRGRPAMIHPRGVTTWGRWDLIGATNGEVDHAVVFDGGMRFLDFHRDESPAVLSPLGSLDWYSNGFWKRSGDP